jgi:hypothetical protein
MGMGLGRVAFMTDKSEWQSPAPAILTTSSLANGGSNVTSSTDNNLRSA